MDNEIIISTESDPISKLFTYLSISVYSFDQMYHAEKPEFRDFDVGSDDVTRLTEDPLYGIYALERIYANYLKGMAISTQDEEFVSRMFSDQSYNLALLVESLLKDFVSIGFEIFDNGEEWILKTGDGRYRLHAPKDRNANDYFFEVVNPDTRDSYAFYLGWNPRRGDLSITLRYLSGVDYRDEEVTMDYLSRNSEIILDEPDPNGHTDIYYEISVWAGLLNLLNSFKD